MTKYMSGGVSINTEGGYCYAYVFIDVKTNALMAKASIMGYS